MLDINLGCETSELVALELIEKDIPFVTLSGYSPEQYPAVFKNVPALIKPLRPQCLVTELRKCIEQKDSECLRRVELFAQ